MERKTFALIDERLVEDTLHLRRALEVPEFPHKKPVVSPGEGIGSVLRDKSGLWRMWYTVFITRDPQKDMVGCETPMALAYSHDGIAWEKPDLKIAKDPIYKDHPNIVVHAKMKDINGRFVSGWGGPAGMCILDAEITPHPRARKRFTGLYVDFPIDVIGGICIADSDDGIHWTIWPESPVIIGSPDTQNILLYDENIKKYVCYLRPVIHCGMDRHANRKIARCESEDLIHWTVPKVVLDTDELDAPGLEVFDEPGMRGARGRNKQFQGISPFIRNSCYIAFTWFYDAVKGIFTNELVHSSDGINWKREPLREPFIADDKPEGFRGKLPVPFGSPPIDVEDTMYFYTSNTPYGHHEIAVADINGSVKNRKQLLESNEIYLITLKRDRWVFYQAGEIEGELLTSPVEWEGGGSFCINAKVEKDGYIRVEVDDIYGRKINDAHLDEIHLITGYVDEVDIPVTFGPGPKTVMKFPFAGPIRFRFWMKKAKLYGWSFVHPVYQQ
ncbi:MAG TPA: hypothetical protein PK303_08145 [bacterium]|nr:hypothetical protein [bacterium]HPP09073.1 hypothetical protein [bacterium]